RLAWPPNLEEVDGPRSSRRGAGARNLLTNQRVQHARFADVGASKEGDLGRRRRRELPDVGSRGQEFGVNAHAGLPNHTEFTPSPVSRAYSIGHWHSHGLR